MKRRIFNAKMQRGRPQPKLNELNGLNKLNELNRATKFAQTAETLMDSSTERQIPNPKPQIPIKSQSEKSHSSQGQRPQLKDRIMAGQNHQGRIMGNGGSAVSAGKILLKMRDSSRYRGDRGIGDKGRPLSPLVPRGEREKHWTPPSAIGSRV